MTVGGPEDANDDDDDAEAAARRRVRASRLSMLAVCAIPVAFIAFWVIRGKLEERASDLHPRAPVAVHELTDADRAEMRAIVATLGPALDTADAAWSTATGRATLAALVPGDAPCPIAIRTADSGSGSAAWAIAVDRYGGTPLVGTNDIAGEAPIRGSQVLNEAHQDVARIGGMLSGKPSDTPGWDAELTNDDLVLLRALRAALPPELVVVGVQDKPQVPALASIVHDFVPGRVHGMAYLYDHRRRAIACAGALDATNSPTIDFSYTSVGGNGDDFQASSSARQKLDLDLRENIARVAATTLRAIHR